MSDFDGINHSLQVIEKVDYIVPQRIREACIARMCNYKEAAERCGIDCVEFGLMANGHKEIPKEYIFHLMKGLDFPKNFFYKIRWERV